jgi:hypothetical protein
MYRAAPWWNLVPSRSACLSARDGFCVSRGRGVVWLICGAVLAIYITKQEGFVSICSAMAPVSFKRSLVQHRIRQLTSCDHGALWDPGLLATMVLCGIQESLQ